MYSLCMNGYWLRNFHEHFSSICIYGLMNFIFACADSYLWNNFILIDFFFIPFFFSFFSSFFNHFCIFFFSSFVCLFGFNFNSLLFCSFLHFSLPFSLPFSYVLSVFQGCTAELQVKNGKKFEGILSTFSPQVSSRSMTLFLLTPRAQSVKDNGDQTQGSKVVSHCRIWTWELSL